MSARPSPTERVRLTISADREVSVEVQAREGPLLARMRDDAWLAAMELVRALVDEHEPAFAEAVESVGAWDEHGAGMVANVLPITGGREAGGRWLLELGRKRGRRPKAWLVAVDDGRVREYVVTDPKIRAQLRIGEHARFAWRPEAGLRLITAVEPKSGPSDGEPRPAAARPQGRLRWLRTGERSGGRSRAGTDAARVQGRQGRWSAARGRGERGRAGDRKRGPGPGQDVSGGDHETRKRAAGRR